jgi:hypothetical protein
MWYIGVQVFFRGSGVYRIDCLWMVSEVRFYEHSNDSSCSVKAGDFFFAKLVNANVSSKIQSYIFLVPYGLRCF